ncbi:MAG: RimK family alpha-L-glutamate ligase [Firmicutes bacterium]|nr:RimK family alpha-L-glutamate ligase [Bacillota bacterium]
MSAMRCWIVYNGYGGEKILQHAKWLADHASRQGITPHIVSNQRLLASFEHGRAALFGDVTAPLPDFVLFWDKDPYLARQLERLGVPVFNSSQTIATCDDKGMTHLVLADHGIPMPRTILAPRTFKKAGILDLAIYDDIADVLGYPLVIKHSYGSYGNQVFLIADRVALQEKVLELAGIPSLFQEYVASSHGTDLRLQVVGGHVVAAMRRVSPNDFRANIGQGATPHPHRPTKEQADIAVRAAAVLGADYAGVDLLFGPGGEPILCEVNTNAHIINLFRCTGIDAGERILSHLRERVRQL